MLCAFYLFYVHRSYRSTETSYFSGDIFNYYIYNCKELKTESFFEIYDAFLIACTKFQYVVSCMNGQKYLKKSFQAAIAYVRILSRTLTAIKQLLLTKINS